MAEEKCPARPEGPRVYAMAEMSSLASLLLDAEVSLRDQADIACYDHDHRRSRHD